MRSQLKVCNRPHLATNALLCLLPWFFVQCQKFFFGAKQHLAACTIQVWQDLNRTSHQDPELFDKMLIYSCQCSMQYALCEVHGSTIQLTSATVLRCLDAFLPIWVFMCVMDLRTTSIKPSYIDATIRLCSGHLGHQDSHQPHMRRDLGDV